MGAFRHPYGRSDTHRLAETTFNGAAFGPWVIDFVRENNRLSGITREPTVAEIAAHRGLFAASTLAVENLVIFVHYLQASARLRDSDESLDNKAAAPTNIREDLDTIIQCAMASLSPPSRLYKLYRLLRPFTDANGRSARALWTWQIVRSAGLRMNRDQIRCDEGADSRVLH